MVLLYVWKIERGQNKMLINCWMYSKTPNKQDDASSCPESLVAVCRKVSIITMVCWMLLHASGFRIHPHQFTKKHCEPTLRNGLVVQMHGDMHRHNQRSTQFFKPWAAPYVVLQTGRLSFFWTNEIRTEPTLNAIRKTLG